MRSRYFEWRLTTEHTAREKESKRQKKGSFLINFVLNVIAMNVIQHFCFVLGSFGAFLLLLNYRVVQRSFCVAIHSLNHAQFAHTEHINQMKKKNAHLITNIIAFDLLNPFRSVTLELVQFKEPGTQKNCSWERWETL